MRVYTMLKTINIAEQIEKEVMRFGNGSIVYTPKKWIGKKVLVILEEKQLDITAELMEILKPHLANIEGIFLYGSFARNEQTKQSDVDVLVITSKRIYLNKKEKFDFLIKTKENFISELKTDPTLFLHQTVQEARPILNAQLLEELKAVQVRSDLHELLDQTLGAFQNVQRLLEAERKKGNPHLESTACIYSLMLRLRGLLRAQLFLKKKEFSTQKFRKLLQSHGFDEKTIEQFIETYRAEREDLKSPYQIQLSDAEKLFEAAKVEFLKTEAMVKK
ncbi:MAG: DUF2080 family transposase-associated protein [Candidatus Diapherotrites archaeon]|nr:DUF2080 family transposase-associated protein [Candidatus Diapherotrites archaeon]